MTQNIYFIVPWEHIVEATDERLLEISQYTAEKDLFNLRKNVAGTHVVVKFLVGTTQEQIMSLNLKYDYPFYTHAQIIELMQSSEWTNSLGI